MRPAKSPMPPPAKLFKSLWQMDSLSASQSLCTLGLAPGSSQLHEELAGTVVLVRGRVQPMLVCQGMRSEVWVVERHILIHIHSQVIWMRRLRVLRRLLVKY